jgi:hypothetical protein
MPFRAVWQLGVCLKGRKSNRKASGESQAVDLERQTYKKSQKDKCNFGTDRNISQRSGLGEFIEIR